MPLPTPLLAAVSTPGGGKLALVVGCGCSFEAPTSIPLAGTCSKESHDRLVANNVITPLDDALQWDLSILADTVFSTTKSQSLLVDQLSEHYSFKDATPNDGHLLAAALLREGVVSTVLTLNFDLAFTTAIGALGVGKDIGIIDGPGDFGKQKTCNVYYLHRNVNAANPEDWVLRTVDLQANWKNGWEKVVAGRVLSTPVVLFAGLGSPWAMTSGRNGGRTSRRLFLKLLLSKSRPGKPLPNLTLPSLSSTQPGVRLNGSTLSLKASSERWERLARRRSQTSPAYATGSPLPKRRPMMLAAGWAKNRLVSRRYADFKQPSKRRLNSSRLWQPSP